MQNIHIGVRGMFRVTSIVQVFLEDTHERYLCIFCTVNVKCCVLLCRVALVIDVDRRMKLVARRIGALLLHINSEERRPLCLDDRIRAEIER